MYEHHELLVDGHRLAYFDEGSGPPILLIHGIPTSSQLWRNIIPRLASKHRVIAPDMLNYGKSDKPLDADVSIAAQSRLMVGILDALGIPRADVVAHDIGGGVAQLMATAHPERLERLVVANSVCFDSWPIPEFQPLQADGAEEQTSLDDFLQMMRDFLPTGVHQPDSVPHSVYDTILEPWSSEDGKRAFFRNLRRLNPEYTQAIAGELKHFANETLILWGSHDPFQAPRYADQLAATLPSARVQWLEAGHWIMEEKPQEVADMLEDFLD